MTLTDRYTRIMEWFAENAESAESELNFNTPFELLVAVILSAQCTDKRVNMVTPALFAKFGTAELMSKASVDELFELISSISYPNNKASNLSKMAKMLHHDFDDVIPDDLEQLKKLPGVGQKTANVVLSIIYDQPRMAVDTHVFRVSKRIGLAPETYNTPMKVEERLMKYIPKELVPKAHHWLILHGRYVCKARKPECEKCGISEWCKTYLSAIK